jgi:hypothetical protein
VCDLAVVPVHLDERIGVRKECLGVLCELMVRLDERPGAREQVDAFTVHACLDESACECDCRLQLRLGAVTRSKLVRAARDCSPLLERRDCDGSREQTRGPLRVGILHALRLLNEPPIRRRLALTLELDLRAKVLEVGAERRIFDRLDRLRSELLGACRVSATPSRVGGSVHPANPSLAHGGETCRTQEPVRRDDLAATMQRGFGRCLQLGGDRLVWTRGRGR